MSGAPEIQTTYSPNYRRINVAGMFGMIQPFGLEAITYSQEPLVDKVLATEPLSPNRTVLKRTVECSLIIDPLQMKSIVNWLNQKIEEYEKIFGRISSPEEIQSRLKRDPQQ